MKEVMNVEELAEYLGIQPVTVYKHSKEGRLPAFKVGSNWRFKKETIDKWIEEQEKKSKRNGSA